MLLDNFDPGSLDCVRLVLSQTPAVRSEWHTFFFLLFVHTAAAHNKGDTIACIYIFDIPLCYDVCLKLLTSCSYIHLGRSTKITKNIVPTLKCAFICCCSFCQVSCKMFVLSQLGLYWRNTP